MAKVRTSYKSTFIYYTSKGQCRPVRWRRHLVRIGALQRCIILQSAQAVRFATNANKLSIFRKVNCACDAVRKFGSLGGDIIHVLYVCLTFLSFAFPLFHGLFSMAFLRTPHRDPISDAIRNCLSVHAGAAGRSLMGSVIPGCDIFADWTHVGAS